MVCLQRYVGPGLTMMMPRPGRVGAGEITYGRLPGPSRAGLTGWEYKVRLGIVGATGRTGRYAVAAALQRGHDVAVLVRDPAKVSGDMAGRVRVVVGDSTDPVGLADLAAGADAVVSALGPTGKQPDLHAQTAQALVEVLRRQGPSRFVGVSGAGIDVPGDRKSAKDRVISRLIQTLGGNAVQDKSAEYQVWAASGLAWTLVRPPRLSDGPASRQPLEQDAHRSTRSTKIIRADLGAFLIDVAENNLYVQLAPFVATPREAFDTRRAAPP